MFALLDFVVRLVLDVERLISIFVQDVLLGVDPISAAIFVAGQGIIGLAVLVFGYIVIGAAFDEIGVKLPSLGGRGRAE